MVDESLNEAAEGDERHCPQLLSILATELGCDPNVMKDVELTQTDTQPGATWAASNEFLSAPRLDNQIHCFTSLEALIGHAVADAAADAGIAMTVCFDHEEVGSESAHGAGSPVMGEAISRVVGCFCASSELLQIKLRRSFQISAYVAHSIHRTGSRSTTRTTSRSSTRAPRSRPTTTSATPPTASRASCCARWPRWSRRPSRIRRAQRLPLRHYHRPEHLGA